MKNRTQLHTVCLCMGASVCLAEMAINVDEQTQRYTIEENGRPVLTYNFGTMPVPEALRGKKYAEPRSNYVHPLYGPDGEILTADFSPDHPHHRGIYWAWPEVTYTGETRDLHALQGLFARPVTIHQQSAAKDSAVISAENIWKWGDTEDIVREFATITAYPRKNGLRIMDFSFTFEALKPGITIARRKQNSYGGFNFRMAPFTDVRIVKHSDAPADFPCRSWAELTGTPPEGKDTLGVFLLQHPANPLYPGEWIDFPKLPWLQPTFPSAGTTYELKPGTPLKLAYRVIVRSGEGLKIAPEKLFTDYAGAMADPLLTMISYQFGENREILTGTEQAIRNASSKEMPAFETRILDLLTQQKTSVDFQRWAFRQLQICGSRKCVPVAAAHLDKDSWMQALDAIIAVPGEPAARVMLQALSTLPDERRAAVIQALGVRRDAAAVPELSKYARDKNALTAGTAVDALGRIGSPEAAHALIATPHTPALSAILIDAKLTCANHLTEVRRADPAALAIYQSLWQDHAVTDTQRAAALIGMVRTAQTVIPEVIAALSSGNNTLVNGAAAALRLSDTQQLIALRSSFANIPDNSKIIVLELWGHRGARETEPEILVHLESANEAIRLAAARALRTSGGKASVPALLAAAVGGGALGAEARISLTQITGDGVFDTLASTAKSGDAKIAIVALDAIGERRDPGYIELMMTMATSADAKTAAKALGTLRSCGTAAALPALRTLLLEGGDAVKPDVASAITALCTRDEHADIAAVIDSKPEITGTARNTLVAALPTLGGEAALAFVSRTRDEPAIRALLNWPESSAVAPLRTIVGDNALDDRLNRLAAAGLLRLVQNTLPVTEQSAALKEALPDIRDDAVRKQVADYIAELLSVNIAKGRPVTSSHPWQGNLKPELAVDGNIKSYWSCAHSPSWISVDLGAEETISRIKVVNYFVDKRYYQYTVDISTDGTAWNSVADMSANTEPATEQGNLFALDGVKARYVRVTMLKNSANPGMHIGELEVYGGGILD